MASVRGGRFLRHHGAVRAGRYRRQETVLAIDQSRRIVAGDLEIVPVGDRVGGAGFHAVSAEDTAVIVDVVDLRVALAAADPYLVGILGGFDVDAVRGTRGGAQKARHAFFQPVLVALQDVYAAIALFELGGLVRIIFRHRGRHHLFQSDAHALGDRGRGLDHLVDLIRHLDSFYRRAARSLAIASGRSVELSTAKCRPPVRSAIL